jgi:Bifunctional DNA primase/polymerase, N-terminal
MPAAHDTAAVTDIRLRLRAAGFSPTPVNGKAAVLNGWQNKHDVNDGEIKLWDSLFPYAGGTGILTQHTPVFDIDISNEEAAEAVEHLARERFEEAGRILVRVGRPPKRAIPFRSGSAFKKISINLIAANGDTSQKLELLADGQQLVCFGIHPDTQLPYQWHGGEPGETKREELPEIDEETARSLLEDAVELLCCDFGYKRAPTRPRKGKSNGAEADVSDGAGAADWAHLAENIRAGRDLHDSLRDLAAKLVRSGMGAGATVNFLRGLMDTTTAEHDKRWLERRYSIPRLVESAQAKQDDKQQQPAEPRTLAEVHETFRRYLGADYDIATLDAMLAVAAAERLPGDPPWLLIISGPGNAKTETVQATSQLGAHVVSTLTSDAALLSATPRKQRAKTATGGLLRKIGERGILVIKDVTSILSTSREIRGPILAALREIHDGQWTRNVGTDGGQTLTWEGRIVVIGACTTAWDQAHAVIATMGDRFVLIRSDSHTGRVGSGLRAMRNTGGEVKMREEMAAAVAGVVSAINTDTVYALTEDDETIIVQAADIVTLARTGVELDYRGDVIDSHAPEMPTRFAKQLTMIMRGAVALGMSRLDALRLVIRCARDSMPQLRLAVLRDVAENQDARVIDVRRRLQKPRATVDRTLQALHILGLLTCREEEAERGGKEIHIRHYKLADGINLDALADPGETAPLL